MRKKIPALIIGAIILIAIVVNVIWFFADTRSKEEEGPVGEQTVEIESFEDWDQELEKAKEDYDPDLGE